MAGIPNVDEYPWEQAGVVPEGVKSSAVPLVLRGFVRAWPSVISAIQSDEAISEYLLAYDAGLPLTIYTSDARNEIIGYKQDYSGFNFNREKSTLKHVVGELLRGDQKRTAYVGSTQVDTWLPGFRQENDIIVNESKPLISFWIGGQTRVAAHYDCPANIACCVAGGRTFTLFPPEQVSNLYVGPLELSPSGRAISLADLDDPDYSKYPKLKEAMVHAQVAELAPGDAIFVPPLWWHHVKSTCRLNLLVNYWWKTVPDYSGNPELALEHAILAIRGLSAKQKAAWKALFEHYVFSEPESAMEHIPLSIQGMLNSTDERAVHRGWLNFIKKLRS